MKRVNFIFSRPFDWKITSSSNALIFKHYQAVTSLESIIVIKPWLLTIILFSSCGRLAHKSSFWARSATVSAKRDRTSAERGARSASEREARASESSCRVRAGSCHTRPENQANDFEKVYSCGYPLCKGWLTCTRKRKFTLCLVKKIVNRWRVCEREKIGEKHTTLEKQQQLS